MTRRTGLFIIVAFFVSLNVVQAQFRANMSFTTTYDDNIDNTYLQTPDRIASLSAGIGYEWAFERDDIDFGYDASYHYYNTAVERTFHYHMLGASYIHLFSEEGDAKLSVDASYALRYDRGDFNIFDNKDFTLTALAAFPFSESMKGEASYTFRSLAFPNATELNSYENAGGFKLTKTFESKTTWIIGTSIGAKSYSNTETIVTSGGGQHGRGRQISQSSNSSVAQWGVMTRIGQSLSDYTGVSIAATHQTNLTSGGSRYLSPAYSSGNAENVFDDHYGYEGWGGSLKVTQILFDHLTLRATGDAQWRDYTGRIAYDLAGNTVASMRSDTRKSISFQAEYTLPGPEIEFTLGIEYIRNQSNDASYSYSNSVFTTGVAIPLP
jgi:hypothetical protein